VLNQGMYEVVRVILEIVVVLHDAIGIGLFVEKRSSFEVYALQDMEDSRTLIQ